MDAGIFYRYTYHRRRRLSVCLNLWNGTRRRHGRRADNLVTAYFHGYAVKNDGQIRISYISLCRLQELGGSEKRPGFRRFCYHVMWSLHFIAKSSRPADRNPYAQTLRSTRKVNI